MRDIGKLLKRRDLAIDQILYGRLASLFLGITGALLTVLSIKGTPSPSAVIRLALYVGIAAIGLALRAKHAWAASLLLVLLTSTFILSIVTSTLLSGLPYRIAVVVVCVNGAVAVFRHRSLEQQIRAAESDGAELNG